MCAECESGDGELLCAEGAAKLLPATTATTLRRWASKGQIAHVRLPNGRLFFRRMDVLAWLEPVVITPVEGVPAVGEEDPDRVGVAAASEEWAEMLSHRGDGV